MAIENEKPDKHTVGEKEIVTPLVGLPEYMRKEQLDGLLPDTVAFVSPFALTYDHKTGGIYLDLATELDESNFTAPYGGKTHTIGIMQVFDESGSHFVVDASGLQPGAIQTEQDLFQEDTPEEQRYTSATRTTRVPLAAIAFTNLEGQIELHGDPRYFDSARHVIATYDTALAANEL